MAGADFKSVGGPARQGRGGFDSHPFRHYTVMRDCVRILLLLSLALLSHSTRVFAIDSTATVDANLGFCVRGQDGFQAYEGTTEFYVNPEGSRWQIRQRCFGASWMVLGKGGQLSSNYIVDFATMFMLLADKSGTLYMLTHAPNTAIAYGLDANRRLHLFVALATDYYFVPTDNSENGTYRYGIVFSPGVGADFALGRTMIRVSGGYDHLVRFSNETSKLGWQVGAAILFTDIVANSP